MFQNILIPTDGSELAAKAVEQGILFSKEIAAKITAVTVTEPFHRTFATHTATRWRNVLKPFAETILRTVRNT